MHVLHDLARRLVDGDEQDLLAQSQPFEEERESEERLSAPAPARNQVGTTLSKAASQHPVETREPDRDPLSAAVVRDAHVASGGRSGAVGSAGAGDGTEGASSGGGPGVAPTTGGAFFFRTTRRLGRGAGVVSGGADAVIVGEGAVEGARAVGSVTTVGGGAKSDSAGTGIDGWAGGTVGAATCVATAA